MKFENMDELRVALACARDGSLTAAAAALQITPAAASASLKRLEARLAVRLFERSTRSMRITPQGELFCAYAQRALDLLDEARGPLDAHHQRLVGAIRLAAPSDLTRQSLLPWLEVFSQQHPAVELHLTVGDAMRDLLRDQVDVALRYGVLQDSTMVARRLFDAHRVVCAAPAYLERHGTPQHPDDLARHECLSFHIRGRRHLVWQLENTQSSPPERMEVRVTGRLSSDDAEVAHRWALAGQGIVYKSGLDMRHSLASGALVRLLPQWQSAPMPLHAVLPSNRFIPARVRALVDFLAQRFAALG